PRPARLDGQRLDRGPGLDAPRDGSRDRDRPREAARGVPRRRGDAGTSARRSPAARRSGRVAPRPIGSASMLSDGFVDATESRDGEALRSALAEGVSFLSPVVFRPYEGRDLVATVLTEGAMK